MAVDAVAQPLHRPDDLLTFRIARLLLLLGLASRLDLKKPVDIERLGFYDFFSANPFLAVRDDEAARREIALRGFSSYDLSYQSTGHRFANRRARLRNDLAMLIAYGLAATVVAAQRVTYRVTDRGLALVSDVTSLYADAYLRSAELVVSRLDRLSDKRLREDAKRWLNDERLLIDLYDVEEMQE